LGKFSPILTALTDNNEKSPWIDRYGSGGGWLVSSPANGYYCKAANLQEPDSKNHALKRTSRAETLSKSTGFRVRFIFRTAIAAAGGGGGGRRG